MKYIFIKYLYNINIYMNKLFLIILILFLLFTFLQIYLYNKKYINNKKTITKLEKFESSLTYLVDTDSKYILDDNSIESILYDYNKLKNI